ncbi:hypothetical protein [Methylocapsa sp. S129]|uniref:hypothetical protein n=1 Tax=Methylocapsa sp. S129 TaxID=1641869 RepID=UPI00131DB6CF|nr:hypothetical protein [Methylocapsa sp. S129]
MIPTLFIVYRDAEAQLSDADLQSVTSVVQTLSGLQDGLAFTPLATGAQPFARDGRGPPLVLQLDFATAQDLDAALTGAGPLAQILRPGALPSLATAAVACQRMIGRRFATPDPTFRLAPNALPCTFLVDYPGTADNLEAWLDHYDAHHPPIMTRFPNIREVATFRPAPETGANLPCARGTSMQRNKVVFDSSDALVAALASPVMDEMRTDSSAFPPYSRRATHFVMATRRLRPLVEIGG